MTNKNNKKSKKGKVRKQRVQSLVMQVFRTKVASYWQPMPFDKKGKFIPSSVDCLYLQDYYGRDEAANMLRSL